MRPLKIVVVGPSKCGKSTIVNLLSSHQGTEPNNSSSGNASKSKRYMETKSCRVVEVENFESYSASSIEFWDIGGRVIHYPEKYLPAALKDADGIMFVFDPNSPAHCDEIKLWYDIVVDIEGKKRNDQTFLVLMHNCSSPSNATLSTSLSQVPLCLSKLKSFNTSHATRSFEMRKHLSSFLRQLTTM